MANTGTEKHAFWEMLVKNVENFAFTHGCF